MNAWKRIVWLLTVIFIFVSHTAGIADDYTLHKPTKDQLTETQAVHAAAMYFEDLTGIPAEDIEKFYVPSEGEKAFGPGWQWQADTEDDCWALCFRTTELPIDSMFATLHGTTGEVLYWEYDDCMTNTTYIHMLPEKGMLLCKEAYELAVEDMGAMLTIEKETILQNAYVTATYGMPYTTFEVNGRDNDALDTPVWDIMIFYPSKSPQLIYQAVIDAESGYISNSYSKEYIP